MASGTLDGTVDLVNLACRYSDCGHVARLGLNGPRPSGMRVLAGGQADGAQALAVGLCPACVATLDVKEVDAVIDFCDVKQVQTRHLTRVHHCLGVMGLSTITALLIELAKMARMSSGDLGAAIAAHRADVVLVLSGVVLFQSPGPNEFSALVMDGAKFGFWANPLIHHVRRWAPGPDEAYVAEVSNAIREERALNVRSVSYRRIKRGRGNG